MHARLTLSGAALWLLIIGIQAMLAMSKGRGLGFLKAFLATQSIIGCVLFVIARFAGSWTYFYFWCAGTVVHHALCAFLVTQIYTVVRRRGLPSRQSLIPLYIMGALSLMAGLHFAGAAAKILTSPLVRLVLPLDHALAFSILCMICLLPAYCIAISSSIPSRLYLVIGGFALYEATYTGKLAIWITSLRFTNQHTADFAYLFSLFLWLFALRSKSPQVAAESRDEYLITTPSAE